MERDILPIGDYEHLRFPKSDKRQQQYLQSVLKDVVSLLPEKSFLRDCLLSDDEFNRWFTAGVISHGVIGRLAECLTTRPPDIDRASDRLYVSFLENRLGTVIHDSSCGELDQLAQIHLLYFPEFMELWENATQDQRIASCKMWMMGYASFVKAQGDELMKEGREAVLKALGLENTGSQLDTPMPEL